MLSWRGVRVLDRARPIGLALALAAACCATEATPPEAAPAAAPAQLAASWLDRPLVNWNVAGQEVPAAPAAEEPRNDIIRRCRLAPQGSTPGERTLAMAGWIPFWPFGAQVLRDEIEIVGGMAGADGMCRPITYNLFVFVAGRFAGVLSPTTMTSRLDGASGAVVLTGDGVTVEFARYTERDPLCCPSSRVLARYRIERAPAPLVAPLGVTLQSGKVEK